MQIQFAVQMHVTVGRGGSKISWSYCLDATLGYRGSQSVTLIYARFSTKGWQ